MWPACNRCCERLASLGREHGKTTVAAVELCRCEGCPRKGAKLRSGSIVLSLCLPFAMRMKSGRRQHATAGPGAAC